MMNILQQKTLWQKGCCTANDDRAAAARVSVAKDVLLYTGLRTTGHSTGEHDRHGIGYAAFGHLVVNTGVRRTFTYFATWSIYLWRRKFVINTSCPHLRVLSTSDHLTAILWTVCFQLSIFMIRVSAWQEKKAKAMKTSEGQLDAHFFKYMVYFCLKQWVVEFEEAEKY
jgi:hypothetical protein